MDVSEDELLRIHSRDLPDHIVQEVAECYETGTYADITITCKGGKEIGAHKMVLAAVSPYIKMVGIMLKGRRGYAHYTLRLRMYNSMRFLLQLLDLCNADDDNCIINLPDVFVEDFRHLMNVVYYGFVEATKEELKRTMLLARDLCILIPVSEELLESLGIQVPVSLLKINPALKQEQSPKLPPLKIKGASNGPPPLKMFKKEPAMSKYKIFFPKLEVD